MDYIGFRYSFWGSYASIRNRRRMAETVIRTRKDEICQLRGKTTVKKKLPHQVTPVSLILGGFSHLSEPFRALEPLRPKRCFFYSMNPTAASWNMANLSSVPGQVNRNHIQNQVSAPKIPKVSLWLIQCFPAKLVASWELIENRDTTKIAKSS